MGATPDLRATCRANSFRSPVASSSFAWASSRARLGDRSSDDVSRSMVLHIRSSTCLSTVVTFPDGVRQEPPLLYETTNFRLSVLFLRSVLGSEFRPVHFLPFVDINVED
jgi:hypothetical protein